MATACNRPDGGQLGKRQSRNSLRCVQAATPTPGLRATGRCLERLEFAWRYALVTGGTAIYRGLPVVSLADLRYGPQLAPTCREAARQRRGASEARPGAAPGEVVVLAKCAGRSTGTPCPLQAHLRPFRPDVVYRGDVQRCPQGRKSANRISSVVNEWMPMHYGCSERPVTLGISAKNDTRQHPARLASCGASRAFRGGQNRSVMVLVAGGHVL